MTDSAIVANQPTKSHQKSSPKTAPEPSMVPVPYKYVYKDNRLCGLCRFCQSESKSESEIKKNECCPTGCQDLCSSPYVVTIYSHSDSGDMCDDICCTIVCLPFKIPFFSSCYLGALLFNEPINTIRIKIYGENTNKEYENYLC